MPRPTDPQPPRSKPSASQRFRSLLRPARVPKSPSPSSNDGDSVRVELGDGTVIWQDSKNGKKHRVGGPAVEYPGGAVQWWFYGLPHRADGPAYTDPAGRQEWWHLGKLHRTDGPAVIAPDGQTEWWFRGTLHRDDGPAIEYGDGRPPEWFHHGSRVAPPTRFDG